MGSIITVIGNIASGKSTLAQRLAEELKADFVAADELFRINPFFQEAVKDRARWSLISDLWFLEERVKLLGAIDRSGDRTTVVDSGLLAGYAYAAFRTSMKQYTEDEWQLYQTYYHRVTQTIPVSDVVVYLKVDPALTMERIRLRGRPHELQNYTQEYIGGFEQGLEFVVQELKQKHVPVIQKIVTTTEAVNESMVSTLVRELRQYE